MGRRLLEEKGSYWPLRSLASGPRGQEEGRDHGVQGSVAEDSEFLSSGTPRSSGRWESSSAGVVLWHILRLLWVHSKTIYHPRGFLQAGSWVTARATELCFRSQAYLWRQGWEGVRQSWALRIQGKGGQSHSWGKVLPMDSLSPGRHQEAVIRGQAQTLSPHRHHRGAFLGKRSRRIEWRLLGLNTCSESALVRRP